MYIITDGIVEFLCWLLWLPLCIIKGIVEWWRECPIPRIVREIKIWRKENPLERSIRRKVKDAYKKHGNEGAEKELLFQLFLHRFEIKNDKRCRGRVLYCSFEYGKQHS